MARYVVHVRSTKSVDDAFSYMADLTNFATWDPGVIKAVQVEGDGPDLGAAYDVTVKGVPRPLTLRYRLTAYDATDRVVAKAQSSFLTSLDTITVRPAGDGGPGGDHGGSIVTYDAELTLNGPLALADPLLKLAFNGIGDRAAAGLIEALDGQRVGAPA